MMDDAGVRMIDVGDKAVTRRIATAYGYITLPENVITAIREGSLPKGDVLTTAKIAGISAAKRTWDTLPMCHNIPIHHVDINFNVKDTCVECFSTVRTDARTGAEMEALMAVQVALSTVYDMTKTIGQGMQISSVCLLEKDGGKSGHVVLPAAIGRVSGLYTGAKGKGNWKTPKPSVVVASDGIEGDGHRGTENPISALLLDAMSQAAPQMLEDAGMNPGEVTWNIEIAGIPYNAVTPGDRLVFQGGTELLVEAVKKPKGRCTNGRYGLAATKGLYLQVIRGGEVSLGESVSLLKNSPLGGE